MLYNTQTITTIGYVAQLSLLQDKLLRQEGFILAKILHLPPNSFKGSNYFDFVHWGSATSVVSLLWLPLR